MLVSTGLSLFAFSVALSKTASNVFIGLTALIVMVLLVRDRAFRHSVLQKVRQPLLPALGIFLSVALFGLLFTRELSGGIGIVNKIIGLLLVYLMVSVLLDAVEGARRDFRYTDQVLLAFLIGIFALDMIGLFTYLGFIADRKYFLPLYPLHIHHIWFSNLNAIGIYVVVAFVFFSSARLRKGQKAFFAAFVIMAAASILLSLSRTAWNGLFVTIVVLSFVFIKNKARVYLFLSALLGTGVLLYLFNDIVQSRLDLIVSDIVSYNKGVTYTNVGARFLLWKASFLMFLSNPLVGVGTGDFVATLHDYIASGTFPGFLKEWNQPHNMFLFTLATNGLIGLLALLYVFYSSLRLGVSSAQAQGRKRMFAFLAVATTVHFMVGGMTDSFLNIQMLRYTFGFMAGVCIRSSIFSKRAGEEAV
jgi:O-antigen ligase